VARWRGVAAWGSRPGGSTEGGRKGRKKGGKENREKRKRKGEKEKGNKKKENKRRKIEKRYIKLGEVSRKIRRRVLRIFLGFSATGVNFRMAVMARRTGRRDRGGAGFPSWWPTAALGGTRG
jgi:hypothetical protein